MTVFDGIEAFTTVFYVLLAAAFLFGIAAIALLLKSISDSDSIEAAAGVIVIEEDDVP